MGKNCDPILIFKNKNATKIGQKRGLVTKVKDNPTVKNDVFKDYLMLERKVLYKANFKIGCRTDPNFVQVKLYY